MSSVKIVVPTPTKTENPVSMNVRSHDHWDEKDEVGFCGSVDMQHERNSNCGKPLTTASLMAQKSAEKASKLSVRTIHHVELSIDANQIYMPVDEIKKELCANSPFLPEDLMLVSGGKKLSDGSKVRSEDLAQQKPFVLLNPACTRTISLKIKPMGSSDVLIVKSTSAAAGTAASSFSAALPTGLEVPANMKVWQLKRKLFTGKYSPLKPESQRLMLNGKLLNDSYMIGDYLFTKQRSLAGSRSRSSSCSSYNRSRSNSTASSCASSLSKRDTDGSVASACAAESAPFAAASPVNPAVSPPAVVYTLFLSKTMNTKHEIDISVKLRNGKSLTFSMEISQRISTIAYILNRQFHIPLPDHEGVSYVYRLHHPIGGPSSSSLSSSSAAGSGAVAMGRTENPTKSKKISNKIENKNGIKSGKDSKKWIELDHSKTLIDYGVTPQIKTLDMDLSFVDEREELKMFRKMFMHGFAPSQSSSSSSPDAFASLPLVARTFQPTGLKSSSSIGQQSATAGSVQQDSGSSSRGSSRSNSETSGDAAAEAGAAAIFSSDASNQQWRSRTVTSEVRRAPTFWELFMYHCLDNADRRINPRPAPPVSAATATDSSSGAAASGAITAAGSAGSAWNSSLSWMGPLAPGFSARSSGSNNVAAEARNSHNNHNSSSSNISGVSGLPPSTLSAGSGSGSGARMVPFSLPPGMEGAQLMSLMEPFFSSSSSSSSDTTTVASSPAVSTSTASAPSTAIGGAATSGTAQKKAAASAPSATAAAAAGGKGMKTGFLIKAGKIPKKQSTSFRSAGAAGTIGREGAGKDGSSLFKGLKRGFLSSGPPSKKQAKGSKPSKNEKDEDGKPLE